MKIRLVDHMTYEELMLLRVLKRAIRHTKTHEELDELQACLEHLHKTVIAKVKEKMK